MSEKKWYRGRKFVAYDGEGIRDRYILLANSAGDRIENPRGLSTLECFEFLARPLSRHASWTRVLFGAGYDMEHWTRDLSAEQRAALGRGETVAVEEYFVRQLGHRIFSIRREGGDRISYYDVRGFFGGSFLAAVEAWLGGVPALLQEGKAARVDFSTWPLDRIREYNALECRLLVALMEKLAPLFRDAPEPLDVRSWHGPGALAALLLRKYGVRHYMRDFSLAEYTPAPLAEAFAAAYFGGRSEAYQLGSFAGPVYRYDLNSAYSWALAYLPRCDYDWTHESSWTPAPDPAASLSVWRVRWAVDPGQPIGPFPHRNGRGDITYPAGGEGWYWYPEVAAARELWPGRVEVVEGYRCATGRYTPLRQLVQRLYAQRRDLAAQGDPRAYVLKLALTSLYGKFLQRSGSHYWYCLPWAGWVTSMIRGHLLRTMARAPAAIVMALTDGLVTTAALPGAPVHNGLGGWSVEQFDGAEVISPGLYRLRRGGWPLAWPRARDWRDDDTGSQGYEALDWEALLDQLGAEGRAVVHQSRFITHALADGWPATYGPRRLRFQTVTKTVRPAAIARRRLGGLTLAQTLPDWRAGSVRLGLLPAPRRPSLPYAPALRPPAEGARDEAERIADA